MQKQEPVMDWPAIVAELHRNGMTLQALAERNGLNPSVFRQVKNSTNFKAQQIIADFVGHNPEDLWPSRYSKGKHRILDTQKFPPLASAKAGANPDSRKVA